MLVHVTIDTAGTVGLDEADDFKAFDIRIAGAERDKALEALGVDGAEAPEDDHVFVTVERVRRLAKEAIGERVDDDWEAGFGGMLGYAGSKGWMSDDGGSIKAHLVSSS